MSRHGIVNSLFGARRNFSTVSSFFIIGLCTVILNPLQAKSETASPPATTSGEAVKEEKPQKSPDLKTGVIANYSKATSATAIGAQTGDSAPGDEPTAISGSIRPGKSGKCDAVLTNTSDTDTFSVNFAIQVLNKSGRISKNIHFSTSVAPHKTSVKSFTCNKKDSMQIVLKSGRVTSSTKKKEEKAAPPASGSVPGAVAPGATAPGGKQAVAPARGGR